MVVDKDELHKNIYSKFPRKYEKEFSFAKKCITVIFGFKCFKLEKF